MKEPVIILVGKTHSGKTTFARSLKESCSRLIVAETDPISLFLKEHYPDVGQHDDKEHTGSFANISLKFIVFQIIVEQALRIDAPLILANSNMWKEGRRRILEICKSAGRRTVGIYFHFPEEVLAKRTEVSARDTRVLRTSHHFGELLKKQADRMQEPDASEFDEFYVVHSQAEYDALLESISKKLL